jgi:hypothetical protein
VRDAIESGAATGIKNVANALYQAAVVDKNTTAQIFFLKCRAGWRDQGPMVEIKNTNQVNVAPDPAVLASDLNRIRDAIKILRSLGVPDTLEMDEADFRALDHHPPSAGLCTTGWADAGGASDCGASAAPAGERRP